MSSSSSSSSSNESQKVLQEQLMKHNLQAVVTDVDHVRVGLRVGGLVGWAVDTDYIITVTTLHDQRPLFQMSKTFRDFRTLAHQLKAIVENDNNDTTLKMGDICQTVEFLHQSIQSQRTEYLGKVNYSYVKALAKQRSMLIDDALEAILNSIPHDYNNNNNNNTPLLQHYMDALQRFFLTHHIPLQQQQQHNDKTATSSNTTTTTNETMDTSTSSTSSSRKSRGLVSSVLKTGKGVKNALEGGGRKVMTALSISAASSTIATTRNVADEPPPPPLESPMVPYSSKTRNDSTQRQLVEQQLRTMGTEAVLTLQPQPQDEQPQQQHTFSHKNKETPRPKSTLPKTHKPHSTTSPEINPWVQLVVVFIAIATLRYLAQASMTIDLDILLLMLFGTFCLGWHAPHTLTTERTTPTTTSTHHHRRRSSLVRTLESRQLLGAEPPTWKRRSLVLPSPRNSTAETAVAELLEDEPDVLLSTLQVFPDDSPLGAFLNRWSQPESQSFRVRGPNYLQDKKKIPSQEFLFPVRGVDLFLTDAAPEHAGRNSSLLAGCLRDVPTFIINFRLPWGILLFYYEIPERFLPFLKARYEDDDDNNTPALDELSPGERTAARFLMNDDDYKNTTLKIVPVVVEGPWIVKSVVGGKPAILGTKLPVTYIYQPEEPGGKHCYLEADLDIVGSSAARGILSVTKTYCQVLTIDLGFVVQANRDDELPEQMLVGTRLHGIDPETAPMLPPMKHMFMARSESSSTLDDDDDDSQ